MTLILTKVTQLVKSRVGTSLGMLVAVLALFATSQQASADDMAECVEGYKRYNANIKAFNLARDAGERAPYCNTIAPEVGYAACEKFIKSGVGTPKQNTWASDVSSSLASVYQKCRAQ